MKRLLFAVALAAGFGGVVSAPAQVYPSRPITIIVPLPPGGAVDALARILAEHMRGTLGQPIVVEHIGGAGGTIAGARVARAAPDGYTIGIGNWSSYVASGAVYPIQYDLLKDFEPVALLPDVPYWLVARKNLPPKDLRELVIWLKDNADKATAATTGAGSASHICSLYFQARTGTKFQLVPYRGGAPALQDVVGSQVDMMCDLAANSRPQVANGNIKAYAVMSKQRWFAAPGAPTADELGAGTMFRPGTGSENQGHAQRSWEANAAAVEAMVDAGVRKRIADLGMDIPAREQQTPEALGASTRPRSRSGG
jgi:tripartite-type tricarboxylate transporter receptor subunit TctC